MTLRLVATDLDGTLLNAQGRVSERTRQALLMVEQHGVPVVFVTGRPMRWMADLWDDVGGHGIAICSNGAIVYDVDERRVATAHTIDREVALTVVERLTSALPGTGFALEKLSGFARDNVFDRHPSDREDMEVGPMAECFDDTVVKLLALHCGHDPELYWRRVAELVGDLVTVTWSSGNALIEMSALGVTKASTLAGVATSLKVTAEEVVAFGDMPNDIDMLRWAGTSYAMANAHPLARAAASRTAPDHDADGVAQVLEELFMGTAG